MIQNQSLPNVHESYPLILSKVSNKLFCVLFFLLTLILFVSFSQLKNTHSDRFELKYILDLWDLQGKLSNFLLSPSALKGELAKICSKGGCVELHSTVDKSELRTGRGSQMLKNLRKSFMDVPYLSL